MSDGLAGQGFHGTPPDGFARGRYHHVGGIGRGRTIPPARKLEKIAFSAGSYAYDGVIDAVADGGFGIHGEIQALLAPASAEGAPAGEKK
ncbi:MAG TPA: hypothetical protein VKH46_11805 [Thermoanaerobaculia bacterium]|nr:hypothetical protein [Thermoanaerobaculia bacterium]